MTSGLVSVVVTTKNEQANIERCLESICIQTYEPIEIIVVDNGSTDLTKTIASQFTSNVFDHGPERSSQRNFGMIAKARGEFVMYVDADMILSPILIAACVSQMTKNAPAALFIPERVLGQGFLSRVRDFERSFYNGTVIDGSRFFRAAEFAAVGGFDTDLFRTGSGEDWDIDKMIKARGQLEMLSVQSEISGHEPWNLSSTVSSLGIDHDPAYAGIYHNESEFSLVKYIKKKGYYSRGFDGYITKWGRDDPDIKKQFGIAYRYFGVFLEKNKWKRLLSRPHLAIAMYFLRFIVGVVYISRNLNIFPKSINTSSEN